MSVPVPELKLYQIVQALISEVNEDFKRHADEKDTFLYHLFGDELGQGKYNYFDQAKSLFVDRADIAEHPKKVEVNMMYNAKRAGTPTIHITLPAETGEWDTIGVGEGGVRATDFVESSTEGTITPLYNRRFQTMYHIICTSESSQEVFLMYHVLRAAMISALDYIDMAGLKNPKLSGQDIRQNDQLVPNHIYMRGIGLSCFYTVEIPRYYDARVIGNLVLTGTPVEVSTD